LGWALACVVASALALACAPIAAAAPLTLSVRDVKAPEGKHAVFTVRLSRKATATVRVRFLTQDGTARKGADYLAKTGKLVFKRGQRVKRVTVKTVPETTDEPSERFAFGLRAPRGAKLKRGKALGTITDDDPTPTVAIADASAAEGNATLPVDWNQASVTITLSNPSSAVLGVQWTASDATAQAGQDYSATPGAVSFAPGQTVKHVTVPVHGDTTDEDDESLDVGLASPTAGLAVGDGSATVTIVDDDPAITDVELSLTDGPDPAIAGGPVTYSVTVENVGPNRAPATAVVDDLPAGLAFRSATSSAGSCAFAAPRVTCALGTVYGSATVTIVAEPTVDGTVTNTVSVSGAYADTDATDDAQTASTTVAAGADLDVTLAESGDPVAAGQDLTYSLQVRNRGPFAAADPVVTQTIPADVSFVDASPGCSYALGLVTCGAGALGTSLAPGQTVPVQVVVGRSAPVAATFSSTATVSSSSPADPDPTDDSATVTTTYVPAGDLTLGVVASGGPLDEGESLSWTATLVNNGPNDAAGVSLGQSLPAGFTLENVTSTHGLCTPSGAAVTCSIGTLAPATPVTVVLSGRPAAGSVGTTLTTTASATSTTADPIPADNSASSSVKVQPKLSIDDVSVQEPVGIFPVAGTKRTVLAVFTITLSRPSPQTITFDYAAVDGTATAGLDFNPAGGPVTFSPGIVTSQLGITVTSDGSSDLPEPNETYFVQLSDFVNVTPLKPQGIGTIVD
jgi:uncharacterized repeat protein (TIGR01451 family)